MFPTTPPIDLDQRRAYSNNVKVRNTNTTGLNLYELVKVMQCKYTKLIWYKIKNSYKGDAKVRKAKLQTHRMRFQILNMNKDEYIVEYFLRVDEVANMIRGLNEKLHEHVVVRNVLISLPIKVIAKIFAIE